MAECLWSLWSWLQSVTAWPLLPTPPSSGFLGIFLLLNHCDTVNVFEYIPSMRLTKRWVNSVGEYRHVVICIDYQPFQVFHYVAWVEYSILTVGAPTVSSIARQCIDSRVTQVSLLRWRGQPRLHSGRLASSVGREVGRSQPQHWPGPPGVQGRLYHHPGLLLLSARPELGPQLLLIDTQYKAISVYQHIDIMSTLYHCYSSILWKYINSWAIIKYLLTFRFLKKIGNDCT